MITAPIVFDQNDDGIVAVLVEDVVPEDVRRRTPRDRAVPVSGTARAGGLTARTHLARLAC